MATALDKYASMKPSWDDPVMIESHQNGIRTKAMNPNTPVTYDELYEDALLCWDAGATAIHVHNSDFDLQGKESFDDYVKVWDRILKARPGMIWYPTTWNNLLVKPEHCCLEHIEYLNKHANVQVAVLNTGIDQFVVYEDEKGNAVGRAYGWDLTLVAKQLEFCMKRDSAMIWGVYEPGLLHVARHYTDWGMFTIGTNRDFYFVGKYGLTSTKPIGTCGMEP